MPYLQVTTNVSVPKHGEKELHTRLAQAMTALPGVEQAWTMTDLHTDHGLWFAESDAPVAMVKVFVYGDVLANGCGQVTQRITKILADALQVSPDRVYVAYFTAQHWGCDGVNYRSTDQ